MAERRHPDPETGLIHQLASDIGPRPSASPEERAAARLISSRLADMGLHPLTESFRSQRSFGPTYLLVFSLALLAGPLGRFSRLAAGFSAFSSLLLGLGELRFPARSPLNLLRTKTSQNVTATIEPAGECRQTICLVSHMDSSRSGLMFHPSVTPSLGKLVEATTAAVLVNAISTLLPGRRAVRSAGSLARAAICAAAAVVLHREVRGINVAGANDNASGVAASLCLARSLVDQPLEHTRVVVLVTGSEESGVIGMREFLASTDTEGWVFLNFDGVSADAPLRVLSRENGPLGPRPDKELLDAADLVGRRSPELRARPLQDGSGLPYDATPVLVRGGRAISIVNQEGAIPDYHWPTDTVEKISEAAFSRAVRFACELVEDLDTAVSET